MAQVTIRTLNSLKRCVPWACGDPLPIQEAFLGCPNIRPPNVSCVSPWFLLHLSPGHVPTNFFFTRNPFTRLPSSVLASRSLKIFHYVSQSVNCLLRISRSLSSFVCRHLSPSLLGPWRCPAFHVVISVCLPKFSVNPFMCLPVSTLVFAL